jgi:hypothetical protein
MKRVVTASLLSWVAVSLAEETDFYHVSDMFVGSTVKDLEGGHYTIVNAKAKCAEMKDCEGFCFQGDAFKGIKPKKVYVFFKGMLGDNALGPGDGWHTYVKDAGKAKDALAKKKIAEGEKNKPAVFKWNEARVSKVSKVLKDKGFEGLLGAEYPASVGQVEMTALEDTVIPNTHTDLYAGQYTLAEAYGLCVTEPKCFGLSFEKTQEVDKMLTKLTVWFKTMIGPETESTSQYVVPLKGWVTYAKPRMDRKDGTAYAYEIGDTVAVTTMHAVIEDAAKVFADYATEKMDWPDKKAKSKLGLGKWIKEWKGEKPHPTGEVVWKWENCQSKVPLLLVGKDTDAVCYLLYTSVKGGSFVPEEHYAVVVDVFGKASLKPSGTSEVAARVRSKSTGEDRRKSEL